MDSQKNQILNDLLTGTRITAIDALNRFQCFRLSARINDLIKDGFNVKSKMIKTGSGKMVAEYWIEPEPKPKVITDSFGQVAMFI